MSAQRFDIVFCGETRDGFAPDAVRDAFGRLFKLPVERIAPLFSGKPCVIKKDLSEADAAKYREVLNRVGAEVELRAREAAPTTDTQPPPAATGATPAAEEQTPDTASYGMTVAPPGELLRNGERPQVTPVEVSDSHLSLVSVFTEVEPPVREAPPPPDTSAITLAEPGADIGPDRSADAEAAVEPATDHIELAPVGPFPATAKPEPVVVGDLSDLSLAPTGEDLLKPDERPPEPAPPDLNLDFDLLDVQPEDQVQH